MRRRSALLLVLATCLVVAILAIPALAYAQEVTGTVTAADTGARMAGVQVIGYYWIGNNTWWLGSAVTDENGEYTISYSIGDPVTFSLHAQDGTGTYDSASSADMAVDPGEDTSVDFVLHRDVRAPVTNMYLTSGLNMSYADELAIAADLPSGIERYGVMSDGKGDIELQADDSWYAYSRSWGRNDGSGIKTVSYSIDGQPWIAKTPADSTYTNWDGIRPLWSRFDIPMLPEGLHSLGYFSVDNNGNAGGARNALIVVDSTAPSTTYDKRAATTKKLKLTASDALTGVGATFLRSGSAGPFVYGTSISVPAKGSKSVQFYSVDKVGNKETTKQLLVSSPASLSTPKPSTTSVSHSKSFTVAGSVFGRGSASGFLRIYRLRNGAYKYVGRKGFTEGADGRYRVSLKLGAGTYKFKASYGGYSATWANPPVGSKMSSKVRVR